MDRPEEVSSKLTSVRAWLDERALDGALLASQTSFAWITAGGRSHISIGEEGGVASVLVTRGEAYLLTTNIELRRLFDEEVSGAAFEGVEWPWYDSAGEAKAVAELCDPSRCVSDMGRAGLTRAEDDFTELRFTLLEPEIERYRELGRDAALAVETACRDTQPGDLEADVAARLASECVVRGILPLVDLVAADHRIAAYRHPLPTSNALGHTLLVALTGRRAGLHASLTRMVAFGDPDDEFVRRMRAVASVDAALITASLPGTSLAEVMKTGVRAYQDQGWGGQWELHHQGGLTGYGGRELFATPDCDYVLRADQALTWNPSITRVKSEDTVLVTTSGHEILTRTGGWPEQDIEGIKRPDVLVL